MPALAIRYTGGTTTFHEPVSAHLAAEFLTVPPPPWLGAWPRSGPAPSTSESGRRPK
ncbi:hypothetical protein ACFQX6_59705 [Streptosporangium lutulentum]